ncbi:protein of unknown function [Magnetospirillum sp. XM-1]|nr:protein of unknown function [Magnetospirillum sp. XM-1]
MFSEYYCCAKCEPDLVIPLEAGAGEVYAAPQQCILEMGLT